MIQGVYENWKPSNFLIPSLCPYNKLDFMNSQRIKRTRIIFVIFIFQVPLELFTDLVTSLCAVDLRQANLTPQQLRYFIHYNTSIFQIFTRPVIGSLPNSSATAVLHTIQHKYFSDFHQTCDCEFTQLLSKCGTSYNTTQLFFRFSPDP